MSRLTKILTVYFCLFGLALSLDDFLDCPGNHVLFGVLRRCCTSNDLPNGCECFDISYRSPFNNSAFHLPRCPKDIDVSFKLFTPSSVSGAIIKAGERSVSNSQFNPALPTRVVAHGFTDSGNAPWMLKMKDEFLIHGPCNVILVDWQKAARAPNYVQAVANTRIVGAMIARLVSDLNIYKGADFKDFHMIGHSLGAHVMGYAGKEIERLRHVKLGRISGLDPAGPLFERYSPVVRVDRSDAMFVDIMHTDAESLVESGFGTRNSIGDVDFYPNGGKHQPGCPPEILGILSMISFDAEKENGTCSHGRAVDFFINSINKCSYESPTGGTACVMGFGTSPECKGDHWPVTTGTPPFC